ncbi:MAG: T9SS type A sorting domain-containing protein [Bacteroidetes bacterium]|nr:T9SS type A sorting domain-containing protein [Bacteroidota bacterium]
MHPDWTPDQVAAQIRVTTDRFSSGPGSKRYGRVNAYKAVTLNDNLDDIPGIRLADFQFSIEGGNFRFTGAGQSARVTVLLENVLAPTSSLAFARVDLDDPSVTTDASDFSLADMNTFDTKTLEFDVRLSETPALSEGYIPIRIRIEDGEYVDFVTGVIPIYLNDAWHSSLIFNTAEVVAMSAPNVSTVWAAGSAQTADIMIKTVNGGGSWSQVGTSGGYPSGKGVYCVEARTNNVALVGTGPENGAAEVYRTVNGGAAWTGSSVSSITGFVNWIHMFDDMNGVLQGDPKNGRWGIATTTDGGVTWTATASPPDAPTGEAGWNEAYAAAGDTVWFGTNNSRIYRSIDRGETWTAIATPAKHSLDMAFGDSKRGIIRFGEITNQGGEYALAVTEDGGDTWTRLTSIEVSGAGTVQMEPNGRRIWYARSSNAWASTDMGESWTVQAIPAEFVYPRCSAIFSNTSLTDVYVAGLGIFKYRSTYQPYETTPVIGPVSAGTFELDALYPNPVSTRAAGVTVGFTLDAVGDTRIDVYDNLGRIVRSGMQARLHAGAHSYTIETTGLPAGNYHIRVQSADRIAVAPLVMMY